MTQPKSKQAETSISETIRTNSDSTALSDQAPDTPVDFGRYRLLKKIGEGGMGAVFLAHDNELDREVALKLPHLHAVANSRESSERFRREARLASKLDNPNICRVYDIGEYQNRLYLTMAYVKGRTLHDVMSNKGAFEAKAAAKLVKKIAEVVQYAHSRGIVHRDLKPSNIMITKDHDFVIMDFGLARKFEQDGAPITASGAVLGTPSYMAPEQLRGEPNAVGPQIDVYSLGVLLYEMLTGERRFRGTVPQIYSQVLNSTCVTSNSADENIAPGLYTICQKATSANLTERYQSASDLADALGDFLSHAEKSKGEIPANVQSSRGGEVQRVQFSGSPPNRRTLFWGTVGFAGFLAGMFGLIVILIRNKDGSVTKLTVPDSSVVEVQKDGQTIAQVEVSANNSKTQSESVDKPLTAGDSVTELSPRDIVDQLTKIGAAVTVIADDKRTEVLNSNELPSEPFQIVKIWSKDAGDRFTDKQLRLLSSCNELKYISLARPVITDKGLKDLQPVEKLEVIHLYFPTNISEEGLGQLLTRAVSVKDLSLSGTPISDQLLQKLVNSPVEAINLEDTSVSDLGIEHLTKLKSLKWISVAKSGVTDAGIKLLTERFPGITIEK